MHSRWRTTYRHTAVFAFLLLAVFGVFVLCTVAFAPDARAQDTFGLEDIEAETRLGAVDFRIIVARIIRAALGLLGIIAVSIVTYGGFVYMTSGGEEEKIGRAKKILLNGAIGLAIILSAFAITQFILTALSRAILGGPSAGPEGEAPAFVSFSGSGALGSIIQDHYPGRDQTDVARNVNIVVTFREAIDPRSVADDTNGNGVFGDCIPPAAGASFDPRAMCDYLKTNNVQIFRSDEKGDPVDDVRLLAAAKIAYEGPEGSRQAKHVVFDPFDFLGSDTEDVWYVVRLTKDILKADGATSAFAAMLGREYWWKFQTGTEFDFDPPTVQSVFPSAGRRMPRNTIVKIEFSEAMDPTTVLGLTNDDVSPFTNIIFGTTTVKGEWRIANGYRTVEFVPDEACGRNSCGDIIYCLPVLPCPAGTASCPITPYEVLVRTATSESDTTWVVSPALSTPNGVADMYGNTLDSGELGVREPKPAIGDPLLIGIEERNPDNFSWNFEVRNDIDRSSPYITEITPRVDDQGVSGDAPIRLTFSHEMWEETLDDGLALLERGNIPAGAIPAGEVLDPIAYVIRSERVGTGDAAVTRSMIRQERPLGPYDLDLFYFATVSSSVKAWNQFCLYPGRGPILTGVSGANGRTCAYSEPEGGTPVNTGCVPVEATDVDENGTVEDTGCAWTGGTVVFPDVDACITELEENL